MIVEEVELFSDATIWMDDLFFFKQQQEKHLEKPFLKDLKNKATNDQRNNQIFEFSLKLTLATLTVKA